MYLNCRVKIPETDGKISVKTISGTQYVYYEYARIYNKKKKYNEPKRTCIGKRDEEQPGFLHPNEKFLKFFPRELLPIERDAGNRSGCIHAEGCAGNARSLGCKYHNEHIRPRFKRIQEKQCKTLG